MTRNCDIYTDVGAAMLAFFREPGNTKYMKPDRRMAFTTPMFELCEWMLKEYKGSTNAK